MIIRVVRGRVRPSSANEFYRRVAEALPAIRACDGLIDVRVGRQHDDAGDAFVFVSFWRDLDAIYRWVGCKDLLFVPSAAGCYDDLVDDSDVQHYEVFGEEDGDASPTELGVRGGTAAADITG